MIKFSSPTLQQYDLFLQMMWDDGQAYMQHALQLMHLTWDEYSQIFRTRGEVVAIYQDAELAGFYWIERRDNTLHLHGLILKPGFQGKGIGTLVLNMLEQQFTGKMERIELGVYQGNPGAIRLYKKLGYQVTQILDDFEFFIMQKPLISAA